jgi:hypothetical protein
MCTQRSNHQQCVQIIANKLEKGDNYLAVTFMEKRRPVNCLNVNHLNSVNKQLMTTENAAGLFVCQADYTQSAQR